MPIVSSWLSVAEYDRMRSPTESAYMPFTTGFAHAATFLAIPSTTRLNAGIIDRAFLFWMVALTNGAFVRVRTWLFFAWCGMIP